MALISVICFSIALNSRVTIVSKSFEAKIRAATAMQNAMETLKSIRMNEGVFIDIENDPNETGLVGTPFSLITTDEGDLDAKLTTLDPNFAAAMVELLASAGVQRGDTVAILTTGSMPGANIAVLIACKELEVVPVAITSIGASQWGANDPDFNWLDMENVLYDSGYIAVKSIAASIGGRNDLGRLLSPRGRQLITTSIDDHDIALIHEDKLASNVESRMKLFAERLPIRLYAACINVGGGVASLGTTFNHRLLPPGLVLRKDIEAISTPGGVEGVISKFSRSGVPVIHILNIRQLTEKLKMPFAPIPLPKIGEGRLYSRQRYNLWITTLCFVIVAGMVFAVGMRSHKQIKGRMEENEPDSVL